MSRFVVLGGDRRAAYLALRAASEGEEVAAVGFERLEGIDLPRAGVTALTTAERVILPVPATTDQYSVSAPFADMVYPLEAVFAALPRGTPVFAGMAEPCTQAAAQKNGLRLFDYCDREEFMLANAIPTAEGALELAMRETDITIRGAKVLVLGFGRVARATAALFHSVGANVTAAARRPSDLTAMGTLGYGAEDIRELRGRVHSWDILINTVPAPVVTAELLAGLPKDCLVLDLASRPGGVDRGAARGLGLNVQWALSLPGRVAPKTAGTIIWDTVRVILKEVAS